MPYVSREKRPLLDLMLARVVTAIRHLAPGEVNYLITRLLIAWIDGVPTYSRLNEAIGVLECAKLELYRRMAAPYEDTKRIENGDVYPGEDAQ